MSVASVQFFSDGLGKQTTFGLLLPSQGDAPFPVLMQLHGLHDGAEAWIQNSNLVRYVERYPMIVVLPDGGTSGYLD